MDPQVFIRLSISSTCVCKIRLRRFPVQTTTVPLISSPESTPDSWAIASSFYLEESNLKALTTPGRFYSTQAHLQISVFTGEKGSHCGVAVKRQQIGIFGFEVIPQWRERKPVILFNGWIGIGKSKQEGKKPVAELHLRVKLDPDPRYVFQFEDQTKLSPQIVQLQGSIRQSICSCKFTQERVPQLNPLSTYWTNGANGSDLKTERRDRKGWKVKIHDLDGRKLEAWKNQRLGLLPILPPSGRSVLRSQGG